MLLVLIALPASGEVAVCGPAATIAHVEGAPADRVTLRNLSTPPWAVERVVWDLEGSAGRLIFDTVTDGAGTNVAQPFRTAGGGAVLAVPPDIPDGATAAVLAFADFPPGARFDFTIDLDDRLRARAGPTVATTETAGARVTVTFRHADGGRETHAARFGADGRARAAAPCLSRATDGNGRRHAPGPAHGATVPDGGRAS